MPKIDAALYRSDVRTTGGDWAEYQAADAGWHRLIIQLGASILLVSVYDVGGGLRRNWQYLWGDVAGAPTTAAPTDGGSARAVGGAIVYTAEGVPHITCDLWLEAGDWVAWSHTGIVAPQSVQYLGEQRPVERSIIV